MISNQSEIDRIFDLLQELLALHSTAAMLGVYRQLVRLLNRVDRIAQQEALDSARQILESLDLDEPIIREALSKISVDSVIRATFVSSILAAAGSLMSGSVPAGLALPIRRLQDLKPSELNAVRDRLQKSVIAVLGSNGRIYRYESQYYLRMVQNDQIYKAVSEAAKMTATRSQGDLVMVSPNASTIGDYCDLYRGRVFSLTGATSGFPLLADTPAGGPPFHPWCHHYLIPVSADSEEVQEDRDKGPLPEAFLELGRSRGSINDFMKLWRADT